MAKPRNPEDEQKAIQEIQTLYVDLQYKQKEIDEVPIKYSKKYATIEAKTIALKDAKLKLDRLFQAKNKELREYFKQKKETLSKNSKSIFTSQKRKEEIESELSSINTTLDALNKMADDMIKLGSVSPPRVLRSNRVELGTPAYPGTPIELGTPRNERPLSPSDQKMLADIEELRARRVALKRSDSDDLGEAAKKPQPIQKSDSQELKSPREQQEVIEGRRAEVATAGGNLIPSEGSPKASIPEPLIPKPPKSLPFLEAIRIGAELKAVDEPKLPEPPSTAPSAEKAVIPPKPPSLLGQIQQGVNLRKSQAAEVKEEPKKPSLLEEMAEQRRKLKVVPEEEKKDKPAHIIEGPSSPHGPFQGSTINNMLAQRERQQPQLTKQPSGVDDSEWGDKLGQSADNLRKSGMAVTGAGSISSPPTTPKSPQRGGGKGRF